MLDIKSGEIQFFSTDSNDGIDVLAKELGILEIGKIDIYTVFEDSKSIIKYHEMDEYEHNMCKKMVPTDKQLRYISINPKHPLLEKFKDRSYLWFDESETKNVTCLFALKADGHDGK